MNKATVPVLVSEADLSSEKLQFDASQIPSPVLARLVEEVRNQNSLLPQAYDRVHNRHNR